MWAILKRFSYYERGCGSFLSWKCSSFSLFLFSVYCNHYCISHLTASCHQVIAIKICKACVFTPVQYLRQFFLESYMLKVRTWPRCTLLGLLCCVLFVHPSYGPSQLLSYFTATFFLHFSWTAVVCRQAVVVLHPRDACSSVTDPSARDVSTLWCGTGIQIFRTNDTVEYWSWIYKVKNDALMLQFLFNGFLTSADPSCLLAVTIVNPCVFLISCFCTDI